MTPVARCVLICLLVAGPMYLASASELLALRIPNPATDPNGSPRFAFVATEGGTHQPLATLPQDYFAEQMIEVPLVWSHNNKMKPAFLTTVGQNTSPQNLTFNILTSSGQKSDVRSNLLLPVTGIPDHVEFFHAAAIDSQQNRLYLLSQSMLADDWSISRVLLRRFNGTLSRPVEVVLPATHSLSSSRALGYHPYRKELYLLLASKTGSDAKYFLGSISLLNNSPVKVLGPLRIDEQGPVQFVTTRSDKLIVYSGGNVYSVQLSNAEASPIDIPKITAKGGEVSFACASPDGSRLYFASWCIWPDGSSCDDTTKKSQLNIVDLATGNRKVVKNEFMRNIALLAAW